MDNRIPDTPQVDFNLLSRNLQSTANEIQKIPNLPAIAGTERILAEIRQMRQESRDQAAHLEARITAVHEELTATRQDFVTRQNARYALPLTLSNIIILIL